MESRGQVIQRLSDEDVAERIEAIGSPTYWRAICPSLSVGRDPPFLDIEETPLSKEQRTTILAQLKHDGYFKSDPVLRPSLLERLRAGLVVLRENGLPPVFAYIFDEFWEIARAPSLQAVVTEALGAGCRQSPRVWAFHLSTENGAAGWPPHVDGGHLAHTTDRLTLWLPLTDATLENGCMNVVPKHLLPPTLPDDFANDARSLSPQIWKTMLQGARPLPAKAGSLLVWDFQVVHWSGFCHGAAAPRMSLAVEVLGPEVAATEGELPLFDLNTLPPFRERLRAIAKGVLSYQRFEPATLRYKSLAQRMLDNIDLEVW